MPGGQRILDGFIYRDIRQLDSLHQNDSAAFDVYRQKVCDSAFKALIRANNMDSLLNSIIDQHHLNKNLQYGLFVGSLAIAFQANKFIRLYNRFHPAPYIDSSIQTPDGIRIGGSLKDIYPQSLVTALTVSSPQANSYRIEFYLYVDVQNRRETILKLMMPTFILSLLSVVFVVLLFFFTFRSWIKQKKLSEMKSDFINSITHEFHTPLTAIIVANRTMQNEKINLDRETLIPLTEVIQRQADRLKTLISQVLELTTLNGITLHKSEYAIHHLLDELLLDYSIRETGSNVNFVFQKEAVRDVVLLDQFWFTTIILNIFDNAIKYNTRETKDIFIGTYSDKRGIYITIRDNGIGMSAEIQKHIYEKFYRSIKNNNEQVKGMGLGMFYVKQAIDTHEWKIDLTSTEGQGSTFIITIPS
jgi:two-component system phosphate regulon sensor histidine kinase PhoR